LRPTATIIGTPTTVDAGSPPSKKSLVHFGSLAVDVTRALDKFLQQPLHVQAELGDDGQWHATQIAPADQVPAARSAAAAPGRPAVLSPNRAPGTSPFAGRSVKSGGAASAQVKPTGGGLVPRAPTPPVSSRIVPPPVTGSDDDFPDIPF
jgi:hypothetical protein